MTITDPDTLISAVALAALLVTMAAYCWNRLRSRRGINSYPPMAPVSPWKFAQAMASDDNPWFLGQVSKEMGTSIFRLALPMWGTPMIVVVGDHKLAREILTDQGTTKPMEMYRPMNWASNGVNSFFASNGSHWHARRKGVVPAFSSQHISRMNAVALAKTDKWIEERLRPLIEEGKSFDVADEMIDLLLVAIADTAFQYDISPNEVKMFKEEIEVVFREYLFKANHNPIRRAFGFLFPGQHRAKLAAKRIQDLSLNIIQAYRKLLNPIKGTIIDMICSNPCYKDDLERTADANTMLIAGHDTTAYSIAWTLKALALNPEIQSELRASIDAAIDEGSAPDQLESVCKVIREAIRLYPVSATGPTRRVSQNFATKEGKLIPAGSIVLFPFLNMFRDPVVFGEDSDMFKPSRWDDSNVTSEMKEAFIPFIVGRQNCVGQRLAITEMNCIVPRIISQFELLVDKEGSHAWFLTLKPSGTMLRARPINRA